jgi:hypothetical protein
MYNVSIDDHIVKKTESPKDMLGHAIVDSPKGDRRKGHNPPLSACRLKGGLFFFVESKNRNNKTSK